jgi:hypothetical protein
LAALVSRKAGFCDEVMRIMHLMGFEVPPFFESNAHVEQYYDPKDTRGLDKP